MDIDITPEALVYIKEQRVNQNYDENYNLRVGVKGGGCQGLETTMDFDTTVKENDIVYEFDGLNIVLNKAHLLYLIGTTLDYSDGLNGKGLFFDNEKHKKCACGTSFSV